ncbi:uncharacterized protein LOC132721982 [Ruditapes philippinarum]|uniref:uncharacterized protein LOC132721982 n=1 Tax=Ruditapes philippinarum TaxID=129788 RepID=UPI00295A9869|nr:uncharacterized protein LOC132721982 [Ruditapes philippinarum]
MTPAEQKEAEANGASLREVKSEVSSNSSCEDIAPFQKRSRRKECIFITIAVVLGAGLIAVLVYFSVTNALKEDEPIARGSQGEDSTSTTPDYGQNYDYQTGDDYNSGPQTRDASGGDSSPGGHLRSMRKYMHDVVQTPSADPEGEMRVMTPFAFSFYAHTKTIKV